MHTSPHEGGCKITKSAWSSKENSLKRPELAKVFGALGEVFIDESNLKGGHWSCRECGKNVIQFNSCLNRHCPKCQGQARRAWVAKHMAGLLPVPYFHVVFTLPHQLNELVRFNPCLVNLLFNAASRTLLKFARDSQHLGAPPGILMVLHNWGQKLNLHYHVHCIVTGGGLAHDGRSWMASKSE